MMWASHLHVNTHSHAWSIHHTSLYIQSSQTIVAVDCAFMNTLSVLCEFLPSE